ncbi:hypothetical protein [Parasulfitobacter algicola]|uniref:Lipoprotein n=1 Tax=Parasulfitobacter algicola TaxID=2614809 RepID=A0ABX2IPQ5_9RHOB|nr:hypothetical protein [Sulfitobacter algicola]NSX53981.1 hypothetical protein [Sulfitobacter algicola]
MPPPAYYGVPATRMTVEGSTFDVRIKDNQAQAIRVNMQYAPRPDRMYPKAALAIEKVSGCRIAKGSLNGDQVIINARLACGGKAPRVPVPVVDQLECEVTDIYENDGLRQVKADVECDAYGKTR